MFLDVNGMVVGAFAHAKYDESRLLLEPGDLLFGYTDGITEAENEFGEMYGEQRLIDVLRQTSELEAPAIIQCVAEAVQKFTGTTELQDDMTMIIARRKA
jgi:sigma-B regulation protein RsbU (phosphoserine phosphatase)